MTKSEIQYNAELIGIVRYAVRSCIVKLSVTILEEKLLKSRQLYRSI